MMCQKSQKTVKILLLLENSVLDCYVWNVLKPDESGISVSISNKHPREWNV